MPAPIVLLLLLPLLKRRFFTVASANHLLQLGLPLTKFLVRPLPLVSTRLYLLLWLPWSRLPPLLTPPLTYKTSIGSFPGKSFLFSPEFTVLLTFLVSRHGLLVSNSHGSTCSNLFVVPLAFLFSPCKGNWGTRLQENPQLILQLVIMIQLTSRRILRD